MDDGRYPFGGMLMCHMAADTTEELNAMADKIGVSRRWIQKAGTYLEHYDICLSKRKLAVRAGAIEMGQLSMMRQVMRPKRKAS